KVLKEILVGDLKPDETVKATQEAQLLSQLHHPAILRFYTSFLERDTFCIVTEFCEVCVCLRSVCVSGLCVSQDGDLECTLERLRASGEAVCESQVSEWLVQLLLGLDYMHQRRILHRDLKTKNVFLKKNMVKIGDLGVSCLLMGSCDLATTLTGTPYYMSPEALGHQGYDSKSDVWRMVFMVFKEGHLVRACPERQSDPGVSERPGQEAAEPAVVVPPAATVRPAAESPGVAAAPEQTESEPQAQPAVQKPTGATLTPEEPCVAEPVTVKSCLAELVSVRHGGTDRDQEKPCLTEPDRERPCSVDSGAVLELPALAEAVGISDHSMYTLNVTRDIVRSLKALEIEIVELQRLEATGNQGHIEALKSKKAKMNDLLDVTAQGALVRSRFTSVTEMDAPSKFFFSLEQKNGQKRFIHAVRTESGDLLSEPTEIRKQTVSFYSKLYSSERSGAQIVEESFLKDLPKLSEQAARELDRDLTLAELHKALQGMENGRAPGIDGLPVEFYKAFWAIIGQDVLEVLNDSVNVGQLPLSCRRAVLTLLPKKGDLTHLKNWRPVSLLCTDIKLLSKALASRLTKVMEQITHQDQSYCVPDQEKAFDRVEHEYLWKVLETFGFNPGFIAMIRVLYCGIESHKLACVDPPPNLLANIQAQLVDFFWDGLHWIPQSVLHLPKEEGGQGLVQLSSRAAAFRLQFIQRLLTGPRDLVWRAAASGLLRTVKGLGLDRALFLMDTKMLDISGLPMFYRGLFKIWNVFKKQNKGCRTVHWLLEEPLVYGGRLDISGVTVPAPSRTLVSSGIVTLRELVNVAGSDLSRAEDLAARMGLRSRRVVNQLLHRWRSALTSEERVQLMDYQHTETGPAEDESFPRLNIAPDLDGCAGPLLECRSEGEMDFGSVSGKLLYRACVKVLNKKKLSGRVDTPWRSVLGFNGDVKPEWRALSLGCILYEMCCLKHAFEGHNFLSVVQKIMESSTPSLPEKYSPELNSLMQRMLERSPSLRVSAAEALSSEVIKALAQRVKQQQLSEETAGDDRDASHIASVLQKKVHLQTLRERSEVEKMSPRERMRLRKQQASDERARKLKHIVEEKYKENHQRMMELRCKNFQRLSINVLTEKAEDTVRQIQPIRRQSSSPSSRPGPIGEQLTETDGNQVVFV
ncbi:hypothetical protein QTP70_014607, partial [Hemibagrus guttatus]